jgi:hypothetical protein
MSMPDTALADHNADDAVRSGEDRYYITALASDFHYQDPRLDAAVTW